MLGAAYILVGVVGGLVLLSPVLQLHRRISISGTVYLTLFVMHGGGAVPFVLDAFRPEKMFVQLPISPDFPLVLAASFLFYALGVRAWVALTSSPLHRSQDHFLRSGVETRDLNYAIYICCVVAVVVAGGFYAWGTGRTGLALLLHEARDAVALKEFRQSFRITNPFYYVGSLTTNFIGPVLLLVSINRAKLCRSWLAWVLPVVLFAVLVLTSTAKLHKAPIVFLLLYVAANRYFWGGGRGVRSWRLWTGGTLLVGALGSLGYYLTYSISPAESFEFVVRRAILVPNICLNAFLQAYPQYLPFNHGTGIGLIAKLVGVTHYITPAVAVGDLFADSPYQVSMNAFWSADLWASFGYPGVVVGSFLVGVFMAGLDWWVLRLRRSVLSVALYSFLVVASIQAMSTSIFTSLLSGGLGLAPVFVLFLGLRFRRRSEAVARVFARVSRRPGSRRGNDHPNSPATASRGDRSSV